MSELVAGVLTDPLTFKTGFIDVGNGGKRYGLAQCNRDLDESSCAGCLSRTTERYSSEKFDNSSSLDVYIGSCNTLYSNYRFYYNSSPPEGKVCY